MLRRERHYDIRILGPNRSRIAVGKIDAAVGQANVINDAGKLLRRYLLADFIFHLVTQSSRFFNARSGWGAQVQREFATIYRWEKILSQPRDQSQGKDAGQKKAGNKDAAVINKCLEQPAICVPDTLKTTFEP